MICSCHVVSIDKHFKISAFLFPFDGFRVYDHMKENQHDITLNTVQAISAPFKEVLSPSLSSHVCIVCAQD